MGIQTFSDERLRFLNRRHDVNQVFKAIDNLRHIGINNISIDLMFGFPRETIDDWMFDIRQALNINVQHISAYSLMYEEGTKTI
jgi:oxygen-independent coproporphyrinogen-3 oxidase